jgi:hypothetical protein
VLGVSSFEAQGVFAVEEVTADKDSVAKSVTRKSKTPQSKSSSKSTQPEAFAVEKKSVVDEKHSDSDERKQQVIASAHEAKSSEKKRKSSTPDTKKQLLALNSKRQNLMNKPASPSSTSSSTSTNTPPSLPPDFCSPVKSAPPSSSPQRKAPLPPAMVMMSFENALPTPKSPITFRHTRVDTTEVCLPVRQSRSPPRATITATMSEETLQRSIAQWETSESQTGVENARGPTSRRRKCPSVPDSALSASSRGSSDSPPKQKQSHDAAAAAATSTTTVCSSTTSAGNGLTFHADSRDDNEQWVEGVTSQDAPLMNGTIFSFANTAEGTPLHYNIESPHAEDTHSESTASFSFDPEEDESDRDVCDKERESAVVRSTNIGDSCALPDTLCSPELSLTPRSGRDKDKDTDHDRRGGIREPGDGNAGRDGHRSQSQVTRRSCIRKDLKRLKEHFDDLKFEFVEEYGEEEAIRLLRIC